MKIDPDKSAFACSATDQDEGSFGVPIRFWLAAHAPEHKTWNFEPSMPPRPKPEYPGETRDLDEEPINIKELNAYDDERVRQMAIQWPFAWADAMIAEANREKA